jgi:predicted PurR-regulated permease PerM
LIVLLGYQQVENNILQPIVYRRTVDVPPLVVIVAVLIGASLLGVLGALVAIPVAAAIQILVRDAWRIHQERQAAEEAPGAGPPPEPPPAEEQPPPEPAAA